MRLDLPIVAAPMAGGASTPAMVVAAARAGGLGFLAAGYKSAQAMADEIASVRAEGVAFGVNLFAPNPLPVDVRAYRRYAAAISAEAEVYGLTLTDVPYEDDDSWADKLDVLIADPVPFVSCTFGIPGRDVVQRLHRAGSQVVLTVTSADEARQAKEAGADVLAVQCSAAGGHSGTLTPQHIPSPTPLVDLLNEVRQVTTLPLLAAGGLATPDDVRAALELADAAVVGTALLLTDESGASATHKAALGQDRPTTITRAFTGRPARGLRNDFIDRYEAAAPLGYPAIHHLTSPLRKAAAAAGDLERVHLWAGTGYRHATTGPVAEVLQRLAGRL